MSVDDVLVRPLVAEDNYAIGEDTMLSVSAPGVLGNDTEVFGTNLSAMIVSGPTNGVLNLNSNGGFTYLPATNYNGSDSFVYQAFEGPNNVGSATVTITVNPINDAPMLPAQADRTIAELETLTVTNSASDVDSPIEGLTYELLNPPAGAVIDSNGIITWTPSDTQGPSTNTITTVVSDGGEPPLSATNTFLVFVHDLHSAPILPLQTNRTMDELTLLSVTNTATENNVPPFDLVYEFLAAPFTATIDTNGIIRWAPLEAAGPGTYTFKTVAIDLESSLRATNSFEVTVNEINSAPVLQRQNDAFISGGQTFTLFNAADDFDLPVNALTYQLLIAPDGASIDPSGFITWTPGTNQVPSTNFFLTVVTDFNPSAMNSQHLSATNSFTVFVLPPGMPPIMGPITVRNGAAVITCSAVIGSTYRLQTKDDLNDASWNDVGPDIIATTNSVTATNAVGTSQTRFYRFVQVQ
jgi:hypothetical protein